MIWNPIVFIGEFVLGSISGAPLAVDSNNQLVSGLSVTKASATADATTTSGTPALLTSMTISPNPGTYLVWFSSSTTSNGTNCVQTFGLYVGGTLQPEAVKTIQPYDGGTLAATTAIADVSITNTVTVTTGQAIEVRWSTAGGTATCHQRTLNILRVV